jgi:hypothetical protein
MYRTLLVFFFVVMCFSGFSASSQISTQPNKVIPLKNDSSAVTLRNFDPQKIKDYSAQREFQYDEQAPVNMSWWDKFWKWIWSLLDGALENRYSGSFIKYLVILIVAALVIFAVIKVIGLDLNIFAGKSKVVDVPYDESLENIHEISFNEEIEKAIANRNYRLAVRLLYLRSLKLLNDRELIDWQPEKTNQAYIDELIDLERKQQFKVLTLQFEYIWYGDFSIDKENFNGIKGSFERFNVKAL